MTVSVFLFTLLISGAAWADSAFPTCPAPELTPGSLCDHPDEFRYPEKIAYCRRDVSTNTKVSIIDRYEKEFGYKIWENDRANFKIDHFIPLCMGGSNRVDNLWPQHKSVYEITDPAEHDLCQKLSQAKITQKEAILKIKTLKISLQSFLMHFILL